MNHRSTDTALAALDKNNPASIDFSCASSATAEFSLPARELSDLLNSQPLPPPIDYDKMFERCLGNVEFAQMLLREFQATAAERVESVSRSIEQSQPADAAFAAHSLKGIAGILGATALLDIAQLVESAGNTADLPRLRDLIAPLCTELQRCLHDIPQVLERSAATATQRFDLP